MSSPPPPPPPHGEAPKTTAGGGSGLPPGKYDVFIIPEHSAGSGFLYLPSLRTNTNSFIAGFATALVLVVLCQSMAPAFQAWWANFQGMGNAGMLLLVIGVGLGAWSLGRQSSDSSGHGGASEGGFYSGGGSMPSGGGFSSAGPSPHAGPQGPAPNGGPPPYANSPPPPQGGSQPSADKPNGSYQRPPPQPQTHQAEPEPTPPPPEPKPQATPQPPPPPPPQPQPQPQPKPSTTKPQAETPKNAWEKAREEVRRQAEERKAKEAEEKRRAEAAARLKELREKEARERAQRDAERMRKEAEAKAQAEKEAKEARAKELRERLVREREERRKKLEEEKKRKEEEANQARKSGSYAYSGVGEKTNPWPNGKPPTASPQAGNPPTPTPASPTKKPPPPTARTVDADEDTHSYRPYDQPKKSTRRMSNSDLSESSWAPSQSTARTTPPPSVRGTYSTKDPDKIVIKAVYCFMNQYAKTPASQLLSGVGSVTDGLILRITTEGLFIDDDVRGVAQREWDVKAWTLKGVEVWCPVHFLACAIAANSPPSPTGAKTPASSGATNLNTAFFARTMGGSARLRAAERGTPKTLTGDDADTYLTEMLASCKDSCQLGDCASKFGYDDTSSVTSGSTRNTDTTAQTGDWKARGLHLLRATVRDQEGKRYMFVIGEEEGWKVAVGLQRLRKGSQVRAFGVAGLGGLETKSTLELLGWG